MARRCGSGLRSVARTVKSLSHYRNVAVYLAARMIYNDGLNVMLAFGGIYAAGVFRWGVVESAAYGILLSVFAALGGLLGGFLADRIGTKRALQLSVGVMIAAALLSLGFAPDRLFFVIPYAAGTEVAAIPVFRTVPELFYIATVIVIAVCLVATYANSRAMIARIAPEDRMTEFFGLYALSGEATALCGAAGVVALATRHRAASNGAWRSSWRFLCRRAFVGLERSCAKNALSLDAIQCRKWRTPVNTMVIPASSAALMTSLSLTEPPGWMTAVAPASTTARRPSGKGKKASDAAAEPLVRGSGQPAASAASRALAAGNARGVDAAHLAGADARGLAVLGIDDGVRLDVFGDGECEEHVGELALASACASGDDLGLGCARSSAILSRVCTRKPPATERKTHPEACGSGKPLAIRRRRFFLAPRMRRASSLASGATMTSVKSLAISSAASPSSTVLNASTPPKALTGSQASALRYASTSDEPNATPQGFACLMMAHVGTAESNSATSS